MDANCKDIWALRHFCDHMKGEVTSAHSTNACPLGNGWRVCIVIDRRGGQSFLPKVLRAI